MANPRTVGLIIVGLVVGTAVGAVALDLAGSDGVEISDGVPISSPNNNTVTVHGDTNISLEEFAPSSDTVDVVTEDGNMTVQSAGNTRVGVLASDITGSKTRLLDITAGGTQITVNPEDKNEISFQGDLTELHWQNIDTSTRQEDIYIAGPDGGTGTVTYDYYSADTDLAAYDIDSGNILDADTSDSSGTASFDIGLSTHSVSIETFDNTAPTLSDFEPSDGTTIKWDNETIAVDVDDDEFNNGDEVEVEFYVDGSLVDTQNITSAQRVDASVTGLSEGDHTYHIEARDRFGGETISSTRTFTVDHYDPVVENLEPQGELTFEPDKVSADISDTDFAFDGDELTVETYINGSLENTETITANNTVGVTLPSSALDGGQHNYTFEVTDKYGNTASASATYSVPSTLYVLTETTPHSLVDNVTIEATITSTGETVDLGTSSDGTFSLTDLPADDTYVFTVQAPGYYSREVFVGDLFDQQSIYLLDENTTSVKNRITVDDATGKFGDGTVILVDRVINTSTISQTADEGPQWVTIGGDRIGSSGFYDINLHEGERYRFRVRNTEGDTRVLSEYTAKTAGEINLEIGSISYSLGDKSSYEWDVSSSEVEGGNYSVTFAYQDYENLTDRVDVAIKTRENGTVISEGEFVDSPYGEVVYTVEINNSTWQNNDFEVVWNAERDGETISGNRILGGNQPLDLPIDRMWTNVGYAGMTFVLAFLVGAGAGAAPAMIVVGLWSGLAVYLELAPPLLGAGATILVIAMGAIVKASQSQDPRR